MSITDKVRRLAGLEARRTPLQRAYALIRRDVHPRQWDTPALEAFSLAENADLHDLSDDELEQIVLYDDAAL
jgi:hypothetical protein